MAEKPSELLKSAIYEGQVHHARHTPVGHSFKYNVFMMYLDLDEVDDVLTLSPLWGRSLFSLARFKASDFHVRGSANISQSIKRLVKEKLGFTPEGSVRMLANLRYFGYIMNPLVVYYCFDKQDRLVAMVAEVNNTPWNEKHPYVLDCNANADYNSHIFDKTFTVSPFNPIDMTYHWASNVPCDTVTLSIKNTQGSETVFQASLALNRTAVTRRSLNRYLIAYPFFTVKVIGAIYWQALKLYMKGVPFLGKNFKASAK